MTKEEKLSIYVRNLKRYEADGDHERAEVQRRLIERLKRK